MFAKCLLLLIVSCLMAWTTNAASPTARPTTGKYDFQLVHMNWSPGVAVGPDFSAIFIIGGDGADVGVILKCPTTSIDRFDCTVWMNQDDYFYTSSTFQTQSSTQLSNIGAYGTGSVYNGELYFVDVGNTEYIYKCTEAFKCYEYIDLSSVGHPSDFIMSSTGLWYWADYQNSIYYECTGTNLNSCSDLGFTITTDPGKMALDSTETIMYFADGSTIQKCTIKSGSCSTYLASTTVIGKDLSNSDLTPDMYTRYQSSIALDASDNVYFPSSSGGRYDIYKCTAANKCSLYLNANTIAPYADDDPTAFDNVFGLKIDAKGFMYVTGGNGVARIGSGAWSAGGSSFTLNSKMYGIIVLALFPFCAFFACGYFFAKHRLGYTKAPTKETEMSQVSHTAV